MNRQQELPLEDQQQVLLDNDFDHVQPHWVEEWLSRKRDRELDH